MLADAEREQQVGELRRGGRAFGNDLQIRRVHTAGIAVLGEKTAGDAADGDSGRGRIGQAAGE